MLQKPKISRWVNLQVQGFQIISSMTHFRSMSSDCGKWPVTENVCVRISYLTWTQINENENSMKWNDGVMKSPKRQEIISLVFTCLCITKSLLMKKLITINNNYMIYELTFTLSVSWTFWVILTINKITLKLKENWK